MSRFNSVPKKSFNKWLAWYREKKSGVYASKQTLDNGEFAYRIYNRRGGLVDCMQLKCDRNAPVYYKED